MKGHDFRIYAKGTSFEDGVYDLRALETLVSSYRSIADRLIAVQLGRRQLTPAIKNQIEYKVQLNPGSIELLIEFLLSHKELFSIFAADGGLVLAEVITKLYRAAINLRKAAAESLKDNLPINITINTNLNIGSGLQVINNGDGGLTINDPKILWAAQVTKHPTDRLISSIDGKDIEFVELSSREEELIITPDDREILGQNKEELSAELWIVGRLDMVAFSSHRGTIVSSNEKFPVNWDENLRSKVQRVVDVEGVEFLVRPIIDQKRLHSEAIAYHVVDCRISQQGLNI